MRPPPETAVAKVTAAAYRIPTDEPEADGTLDWDATTVVVVTVSTADPGAPVGVGWTYAPAATAAVVCDVLADEVVGQQVWDVPRIWTAMARRVRNAGRPGVAGTAISAVDVALWDLKARLLDLPLAVLFGRLRDEVPVYGSGGFTTYDDDRLRRQVEGWLADGITQVKIKIGEDAGSAESRDVRRAALVRRLVGDQVGVFVDANGAYGVAQARRVGRRLDELGVSWFEEPVTSDDLSGLRRVRDAVEADVTAGEYGYDLGYFAGMLGAGAVDCLQIDATRCGGYTEWLRVAAVAAAHHTDVSAHCAPLLHLPVAAGTPRLRHLEWFHDHVRIEGRLLGGPVPVHDGVLRLPEGPGHGFELRADAVSPFRVA